MVGLLQNSIALINIYAPPVYQSELIIASVLILMSPQMYWLCYGDLLYKRGTHPGVMLRVTQ